MINQAKSGPARKLPAIKHAPGPETGELQNLCRMPTTVETWLLPDEGNSV